MTNAWIISESGFDSARNLAAEALFAQGSGYLQIRGSLEESLSGMEQNRDFTRLPGNVTAEKFSETCVKWGTYVPGIYGMHPLLDKEMVNLPYICGIELSIAGETFDPLKSSFNDWKRSLDLRNGVLTRSFVWIPKKGPKINVVFTRFVSAARTHCVFQRLELRAESDCVIYVGAGIYADTRTSGYDHLRDIGFRVEGGAVICEFGTDLGESVEMASTLAGVEDASVKESGRNIAVTGKAEVRAGKTVFCEKRSCVCTGRDGKPLSTEALLSDVAGKSFKELSAENEKIWSERWRESDVEVRGDDFAQLSIRASIYHLLRCHVPDLRVAIDAKGYSGDAYFGRFFWDTEMYMLPFFLYTAPEKARTLTDFRIQSLRGAEENAKEYGCAGARFAWESDSEGNECCPKLNWQYRDHEIHVTGDVVYGIAHYAAATGDKSYLHNDAADLIIETARYWMDRIDTTGGRPVLLGVMGPDEYSPLTNNNSYTNRIAKFNLSLAAKFGNKKGVAAEEIQKWLHTAEHLPLPRRSDGLLLPHDAWEQLADPEFSKWWPERHKLFAKTVTQDRIYRTKAAKQADVLMLAWLFPKEFSAEELKSAWDNYEPLCTHDSSLSAGIHALLALRLGLTDKAVEYWDRTAGLDIDTGNGHAAQGIHIACAGAVWMIAVFGFAGLKTAMESECLSIDPKLPPGWERITFRIKWRGVPLKITVSPEKVDIQNLGGKDITAAVNGTKRVIEPFPDGN